MRKRLLNSIVLVPLLFSATVATAQDAELERQVVETQNDYMEAWTAGDAEALANLFTEDAVFLPPMGGMFEGRDQIRSHFEEEFGQQMIPDSVQISSSRVERLNGYILDVGTFTLGMPEEAGGEFQGEYVVVGEETDDGIRVHRLIGFSERRMPED